MALKFSIENAGEKLRISRCIQRKLKAICGPRHLTETHAYTHMVLHKVLSVEFLCQFKLRLCVWLFCLLSKFATHRNGTEKRWNKIKTPTNLLTHTVKTCECRCYGRFANILPYIFFPFGWDYLKLLTPNFIHALAPRTSHQTPLGSVILLSTEWNEWKKYFITKNCKEKKSGAQEKESSFYIVFNQTVTAVATPTTNERERKVCALYWPRYTQAPTKCHREITVKRSFIMLIWKVLLSVVCFFFVFFSFLFFTLGLYVLCVYMCAWEGGVFQSLPKNHVFVNLCSFSFFYISWIMLDC